MKKKISLCEFDKKLRIAESLFSAGLSVLNRINTSKIMENCQACKGQCWVGGGKLSVWQRCEKCKGKGYIDNF